LRPAETKRAVPTFLGIGVPRAGTTWLHDLLATHPAVFVPTRRKEVHYFDVNYGRGPGWYAEYFPAAGSYQAVGEITPHYLYCRDCPDRIAAFGGIDRLIVMLRHPTQRAYSHYGLFVRNTGFRGTFQEFVRDHPNALEWGKYSSYLPNYLGRFPGRVLVLVQEEVFSDVPSARRDIAMFLGIDPGGFPAAAGTERVNKAIVPRRRGAYRLAMRAVRALNSSGHDWLIRAAKSLGAKRFLARGTELPKMSEADRETVDQFYEEEIKRTESLLGRSVARWRRAADRP
jgi:hypothetical protein